MVVSEYFEAKTLHSFLKKTRPSIEDSFFILSQILKGLDYLHSHQIVHRDFNAKNILFDPLSKTVKIIDFGLSKVLDSRNGIYSPQGNVWFRPPDVEELKNPFFEDVWNFAILALSFFCDDKLTTEKVCDLLKNMNIIADQRKDILQILKICMSEAYESKDELIGEYQTPLKKFKELFSWA